ncbi:hypothetical protein [Thalassoroseus pseudoceratinae]|uniref:hypothetical protein n=1 Tax=Thalassoroseus pseudoceratinae TaxID=2713176 RepID=UPI001423D095|nr:hypothetical protein [Thalassoroseus pseudoceratinae]
MANRFFNGKVRILVICIVHAMYAGVHANHKAEDSQGASGSPALSMLATSAEEGCFTYVLFWRNNDDATQRMGTNLQQATSRMKLRVNTVSVRVTDPHELETVKRFDVERAPLPLIIAVAPNGAVTKAWFLKASREQLHEGLVSAGTAACLKAMQQKKLSLICVYNSVTAHRDSLKQAAIGIKADRRFGAATEVIEIDPADVREHAFLASLQVKPNSNEAVAVLVSPAGHPIGKMTGAVTATQLIKTIEAAMQGCCPGGTCGPEGGCPGGQCPPQRK